METHVGENVRGRTMGLMKTLGLVAAILMALGMAIGVAGCSGGSDSGKAFVGVWTLESMEGEDVPDAEEIASMAEIGMAIDLTLTEEGEAYFDFMGDIMEVVWEAQSDKGATVTINADTVDVTLEGDKLKMAKEGAAMIFVKTDAEPVAPVVEEEDVEVTEDVQSK